MCDVGESAVVAAIDAPSIYDIPKVLHSEGLDAYVVRRLDLRFRDVDWTQWNDLLTRVHHPKEEVVIALVGKYIDLPDAYLSVCEALRAGGLANYAKAVVRWVPSDGCATEGGRDASVARCGRRRDSGVASGFAVWKGRLGRSATPGRTRSQSWACALACNAW